MSGGGAELDDPGRVDGLSAEPEGDPHRFGVRAEVEVLRHGEGDRADGWKREHKPSCNFSLVALLVLAGAWSKPHIH
jgi:hypothetical protein